MSEEMQIPEGARVVIHVPPMPESELVKHLQDMYVQVQRDLSRYRVDAINEAQRRRAAEDERDDLERELAASQAETLELRQRVADSATGMETLQQRIAELEQERNVMRLIACEAYEHWDADRDSKVGKLLAALGGTPGIRVDLDKARSEAVPHA